MFSQFRQAVESLAQPLPRHSQDNAPPADVRCRSPDSQRPSSAQLAENALVNLRKSTAAQRTASPAQQNTATANPRSRSASPSPLSTAGSTGGSGLRKTTLEERLRASFAVSESPGGNALNPSTSAPPTSHAVPVAQHPLSPASTPIPDSPTDTATFSLENLVGDSFQAKECKDTHNASPPQEPTDTAQPPSAAPPAEPQESASLTVGTTDSLSIDSTTDPCVGVAPTQEAPRASHTEPPPHTQQYTQASEVVDASTVDANPPGEDCVEPEPEPTITDSSKDAGIEVLQERLRLVEQRFAGKVAYIAHLGEHKYWV